MEKVLLEQKKGGEWIALFWVNYNDVITRLVGLTQNNPESEFRVHNVANYITDKY